jgi:hypothetical protein
MTARAKAPPKILSMKRAVDLLHQQGHCLILMHTTKGLAYFVVPGGPVDREAAEKIITRPDMHAHDNGLFPGRTQSWKMG